MLRLGLAMSTPDLNVEAPTPDVGRGTHDVEARTPGPDGVGFKCARWDRSFRLTARQTHSR